MFKFVKDEKDPFKLKVFYPDGTPFHIGKHLEKEFDAGKMQKK